MVPKSLVGILLKGVHDNNGHRGVDRVIVRINLKFNWPGKYRDIRSHIRSCEVCNMCKLGNGKVEMGRLRADKPLDLVDLSIFNSRQVNRWEGTYFSHNRLLGKILKSDTD